MERQDVCDLEQLVRAASERKAVKWNGATRPVSAAFVLGMQGRKIWALILKGMWIHVPKQKPEKEIKTPDWMRSAMGGRSYTD